MQGSVEKSKNIRTVVMPWHSRELDTFLQASLAIGQGLQGASEESDF